MRNGVLKRNFKMKNFLVLLLMLVSSLSVFAQTPSQKKEVPMDTIVKLGGRKLIVDVTKVTATDVYFMQPNKQEVISIERKQIEKIIYRSGKIEQLNKPLLMMVDEGSWEGVLITDNKDETKGLYEVGLVNAISASNSRSKKAAKQSATIRLQKRAANLGAYIIYLTKAEAKGGYGEIPGYEMEGIAYSLTPPEKAPEDDIE